MADARVEALAVTGSDALMGPFVLVGASPALWAMIIISKTTTPVPYFVLIIRIVPVSIASVKRFLMMMSAVTNPLALIVLAVRQTITTIRGFAKSQKTVPVLS